MLKIANIVTNCELLNHKKLDYVNYCDDMSKIIADLPILVIGWDYVNAKIGSIKSILDKEINPRLFWEFSPNEDIIQYTNGLEKFIKDAPTLFINRFNYINADPFNYKVYTPVDLENKLSKISHGNLYVYKNDMAYYLVLDKIYGFKLPIYDAIMGKNVTLNALKSISYNQIIDEGDLFQKYYKIFPEFQLLKRSMVVFAFS